MGERSEREKVVEYGREESLSVVSQRVCRK